MGVEGRSPSVHWRLKATRYRLEGFPFNRLGIDGLPAEGETLGLETEIRDHRLMGAMMLTVFDGRLVLLPDEAKAEGVGQVNTWEMESTVGRYGIPAGGQMGRETTYGTLFRELAEEMPQFDQVLINRRQFGQVSTYPFVVNQLKFGESGELSKVNQIAVTVRSLDISDNVQLQEEFSRAGGVVWPLDNIARHADQLFSGNGNNQLMFRPQVVVAAAFAVGKLDTAACIELNQITIRNGYQLAHQYDVSVFNGSFQTDGQLSPGLTVDQKHYLGVE